MAIEKSTVVDRLEIDRRAVIQIRLQMEIVEDTVVLMHRYHRFVLEPGDNLASRLQEINAALTANKVPTIPVGQSNRIGQIANLLWTPAVIAAYAAWKEANSNAT